MADHPPTPPHALADPGERIRAIWRVGLSAWRAMRNSGTFNEDANQRAGCEAIQAAYPEMSREEAARHLVEGMAWASTPPSMAGSWSAAARMDLAA
jgi:hypothetical protein